jgi:dihydroorotase
MIRRAKAQGLSVSCDVAAHQLHLTEIDIGYFDSNCRLTPPLRNERDRAALRAGLRDGTIDAICSDHTPVDEDAKQLPFGEAEAGASGLELLLPLALRWGQECDLPLAQTLDRVSTAPGRIVGLGSGNLVVGAPADLCLFDPDLTWWVEPAMMRSHGKNTPFSGTEMRGKVRYTLVDGHIAYEA